MERSVVDISTDDNSEMCINLNIFALPYLYYPHTKVGHGKEEEDHSQIFLFFLDL
jgi:hypothetical protein